MFRLCVLGSLDILLAINVNKLGKYYICFVTFSMMYLVNETIPWSCECILERVKVFQAKFITTTYFTEFV